MERTGQFHGPAALTPGKQPCVTVEQEDGWTFWRRQKSLVSASKGNTMVQPVAQSLYRPGYPTLNTPSNATLETEF